MLRRVSGGFSAGRRRALLSGVAAPAPLVTNGTFSDGLTGWTADSGWAASSGAARASTQFRNLAQTIGLVQGQTYDFSFDFVYSGIPLRLMWGLTSGGTTTVAEFSSSGAKSGQFTVSQPTNGQITFRALAGTGSSDIDNVVISPST